MKKGFTLIEAMVAIGLFTIVAVVALGALLTVSSASSRSQNTRSLVDEVGYMLEDISRTAQGSSAFSSCGSSSGCSYFSLTDASGNQVVYTFTTDSGRGVLQKSIQPPGGGGATAVSLTPAGIDIKNMSFFLTDPETAGLQPRVLIVLDAVVGENGKYSNSINLQTTVTERPQS